MITSSKRVEYDHEIFRKILEEVRNFSSAWRIYSLYNPISFSSAYYNFKRKEGMTPREYLNSGAHRKVHVKPKKKSDGFSFFLNENEVVVPEKVIERYRWLYAERVSKDDNVTPENFNKIDREAKYKPIPFTEEERNFLESEIKRAYMNALENENLNKQRFSGKGRDLIVKFHMRNGVIYVNGLQIRKDSDKSIRNFERSLEEILLL